jgi:hypothetical protein
LPAVENWKSGRMEERKDGRERGNGYLIWVCFFEFSFFEEQLCGGKLKVEN